MPPPDSHKTLTRASEGNPQAVDRAGRRVSAALGVRAAGQSGDSRRVKTASMSWCGSGLAEVGLKPSPEADRRTLIRRLVLRPDRAAADAGGSGRVRAATRHPTRTKSWSTGCSQNPHYGERMAIGWLDVVRFADTIGYHSDNPRNVWPYRDWVIRSFNENKPFDRFTIEQIAGDLLPDATQRDARRLGLQSPAADDRGRWRTAQGLRGADADRSRACHRHGVARADDGLRPVPRSQVRSVHDARLLLAGRVLRRHREPIHRPPRETACR